MGWLQAAVGAVGAIGGGLLGSSASSKASKAQERAAESQINFARESRDMAREDQAPYREAGYTALNALLGLTGLQAPNSVSRAAQGLPSAEATLFDVPRSGKASEHDVIKAFEQYVGRRPTAVELEYYTSRDRANQLYDNAVVPNRERVLRQMQQQQGGQPGTAVSPEAMLRADPGYQFRMNEGMRALDRGASARGGVLSGGAIRGATRYAQDYASNEYQNVYNRISNIAGLGQVGSQVSSQAAMQYGTQAGQAAQNAGYSRASGYVGQANAWGNAINQVAQLPWGEMFKRAPSGGGSTAPYDPSNPYV